MDIEHDVKVIPIDEGLQPALEKLQAEGWTVAAGVVPVAVYHLVRLKRAPAGAGFGRLHIDDTKVKILKSDGTLQ